MMSRIKFIPIMLAVLFLLPLTGFAEDGKAIFVIGKVEVMNADGEKSPLKRGSEVNSGDVILTSGKGQAQIKMIDGTLLAVRPNSEFKITDYQYNQDVTSDKSVYGLVKGGFRSITGKMGKAKKSSYAVKTVVGTIGIRGTDFTARLCESNCGDQEDGLYVGVMEGGVKLTNDSGSLDVSPGDFGFMADSGVEPVYLDEMPGDLLFAKSNSSEATVASTTSSSSETSSTSIASVADDQSDIAIPISITKDGEEIDLAALTAGEMDALRDPADTTEPAILLPTTGSADYQVGTFTQQIDGIESFDLDIAATTLTVDFVSTAVDATIVSTIGSDTWEATSHGITYDTSNGAFVWTDEAGLGNMDLVIKGTDIFGAPTQSTGAFGTITNGSLGAITTSGETPTTATIDYEMIDTVVVDGQLNMELLTTHP